MRYDSNKMWQYPVLRPESDDYPTSELQVTVDVQRMKDSTALRTTVDFALGDGDLSKLIENHLAQYMVVVRCSKTYFRQMTPTFSERLVFDIPANQVFGEIEISPYIVAVDEILNFRAAGWHEDYNSISMSPLGPGAVLALDIPKRYHIDNAEELTVNSILEVQPGNPEKGQWDCDFDAERVKITMSNEDYQKFCFARQERIGRVEQAYVLNSIYFPAIYHILITADAEESTYMERRWYRALDKRLEEIEAGTLGETGRNRLQDAQRLLENPFSRLPFIALDAQR